MVFEIETEIKFNGKIKVDAPDYETALRYLEDEPTADSPLLNSQANECWEVSIEEV